MWYSSFSIIEGEQGKHVTSREIPVVNLGAWMFVLASGKGEETLLKDPGLAFPNLTNFQGAPILSIGVAELRVVKGKIQEDSLMRGFVYHNQNQHEGKSAAISVHCLLKEDNGGPRFFGSGRLGVSLFVNNALGQNTGETLIMNKTEYAIGLLWRILKIWRKWILKPTQT